MSDAPDRPSSTSSRGGLRAHERPPRPGSRACSSRCRSRRCRARRGQGMAAPCFVCVHRDGTATASKGDDSSAIAAICALTSRPGHRESHRAEGDLSPWLIQTSSRRCPFPLPDLDVAEPAEWPRATHLRVAELAHLPVSTVRPSARPSPACRSSAQTYGTPARPHLVRVARGRVTSVTCLTAGEDILCGEVRG